MAPENKNSLWLLVVVSPPHNIQNKSTHRTLYTVICLKIRLSPSLFSNTHMLNFSLFLKVPPLRKMAAKSKEKRT